MFHKHCTGLTGRHAPAQVWEWLEGGTFAQEQLDSGAATPDSAAAAAHSSPHPDAAASAGGAAGSPKALSHIYGLTGEVRPALDRALEACL